MARRRRRSVARERAWRRARPRRAHGRESVSATLPGDRRQPYGCGLSCDARCVCGEREEARRAGDAGLERGVRREAQLRQVFSAASSTAGSASRERTSFTQTLKLSGAAARHAGAGYYPPRASSTRRPRDRATRALTLGASARRLNRRPSPQARLAATRRGQRLRARLRGPRSPPAPGAMRSRGAGSSAAR